MVGGMNALWWLSGDRSSSRFAGAERRTGRAAQDVRAAARVLSQAAVELSRFAAGRGRGEPYGDLRRRRWTARARAGASSGAIAGARRLGRGRESAAPSTCGCREMRARGAGGPGRCRWVHGGVAIARGADRRVGPARGRGGGAVHLPRPPASRCVARARAFRPRALYRPAAEPVRVLPFWRRRAPLPRDGVRALGDEGGAGGGGVARRAPPRDRVPYAARAAEHHSRAVEGHAGGSRAAGRLRTIPADTLLWRGRVRPATLCSVVGEVS